MDSPEVIKNTTDIAQRLAKVDSSPATEAPTEAAPEAKAEDAPKVETTNTSPEPEVAETSEKTEKTPEPEVKEAPLPEQTPEANRAFADMRRQRDEALAEVDNFRRQAEPETAGVIPESPPPGGYIDPSAFVDPQTQEIDLPSYTRALEATTLTRASAIAGQRIEEFKQEQDAYSVYPELNPKSENFDSELYKATRGVLLDSMLRPNEYKGKPLSLREAAQKVKSFGKTELEEAKAEGAKEAVAQIAKKEEISLEATGNSGRGASSDAALTEQVEDEARREASRLGGPRGTKALADRLSKSGF